MEAIIIFRDSLSTAQMNEKGEGTQADSARVKWRMSQVTERCGITKVKAFAKPMKQLKRN